MVHYANMPTPSEMIKYYTSIEDKITGKKEKERKDRLKNAGNTMHVRYRLLTNLQHANLLYKSNVNDEFRTIITRWRLSSHSLHIETGRYKKPKTLPENRICTVCGTVEDEYHSIYICPMHYFILSIHRITEKIR